MSTLSYPPLYASACALQLVVVVTVAYERLPGPLRIPFAIFWLLVLSVSMLLGYELRNVSSGNRLLQWLPLATLLGLLILWVMLAGPRLLFLISGLGLLTGRNVVLATRRALYFDLAIVLTIFYDTIGIEPTLRLWPFALAFLMALVFVLMADYSDRRMAYVRADDADARAALAPGLRNATLATALVLAAGAFVYFLLPQPDALNLGIPFGDSPGSGYYADRAPAGSVPGRGGSKPGDGPGSAAELADGPGGYVLGRVRQSLLDTRSKGPGCAPDSMSDIAKGQAGAAAASGESQPPDARALTMIYLDADRPLYVRTHAFVVLRRGRWSESPGGFDEVRSRGPFIFGRSPAADAVRQNYLVNAELDPHIPGAHRVDQIAFPATGLGRSPDHGLLAFAPKLIPGTRYATRSSVQYIGERPSGGFERVTTSFAAYLQLPPESTVRLHELVRSIIQVRAEPSRRAEALEAHLRRNYTRGSFDVGDGDRDGDAMEQFLFEQRRGGSAQFASALALMLRAAEVPSRVAVGYRARRLNPLHGDFELWKSDSHCWVEAYVDGRWTIYEPSPWAALPPRRAHASPWLAAQNYVLLATTDDTGSPIDRLHRPSENYLRLVLAWGWTATFGPWVLLGLVLAALGAWRYQRWLRPLLDAYDLYSLRRRGTPREWVLAAYRTLERIFARRDLRRNPAENHAEYLSRLAAGRPHLASSLLAISGIFAAARYGAAEMPAEAGERVASSCREILELIDEQLPPVN